MSDTLSSLSNGGVNSSIPLQAGRGVQQPNPLQQIGQFANTVNALNQAKMFPGALALQGGQQTLQDQEIQRGNVINQNTINQAVAGALAPLLAPSNGPITHKSLTDALGSIEANLHIPTNGIIQHLTSQLPTGDGPAFNAAAHSYVQAWSQPPSGAVAAVSPTPGTIGIGNAVQPVLTPAPGSANQTQGPSLAGAPITTFLSPAERAAQTTRPATQADVDAAARTGQPPILIGTPITEPMQTRLQQQGAGNLLGPVVGTGGPVSPQNPPRLGQVAPTGKSVPTGQVAAPAQSTGAVQTGLAPTAPAEMESSVNQYNAASVNSNNYQQRVFPLKQAAIALQNTDTGPGTETVNHIKSFLLAQTPASLQQYLPGVDPEKITSYDESVKYLAQYERNQPGAERSDMAQALAQTANASTHINQEAAQRVVNNALGLENMQQAALTQFNELHSDPNTGAIKPGSGALFNQFMQKFAATHDPRGFSWDDQGPAQQAATLKTVKTVADKIKLRDSRDLARHYQLTGVPGG
jgi:hypothetical protein